MLVTALPAALLALLCAGTYRIIHTLLPPASLALWHGGGWMLAGLTTATLLAAGRAWRRQQALGVGYAVGTLLAYSALLGWSLAYGNELLPREVPTWMVPTGVVYYAWTFLMPTLVHALLVLVVRTTPRGGDHEAWPNFVLALGVPPLAGLGGWIIGGIANALGFNWLPDWLTTLLASLLLAVGPIALLYGLVRGVYVLLERRRTPGWGEVRLLWKIVLSLVLPLAGLALNRGVGNFSSDADAGLFGNFNGFWFWALAALNGVLLCVPAERLPAGGRLGLLAGRSALLGYTAYFFVVFLPFLPLSVLAIVLIGTGFLLLAPLLLLLLHLHELAADLAALQPRFGRVGPLAVLLGGAAVLPLAITGAYYHQRQVLHEALAYAYSPDFRQTVHLDADALGRTLAVVRQHKTAERGFGNGHQQPYLSAYFNWLVLDNLTLSEDKLAELDKLFLNTQTGAAGRWRQPVPLPVGLGARVQPQGPSLRQLRARSQYDPHQQAWVSHLDLEVANADPATQRGEYATSFELPPGCWVRSYYLEVNGRREPGLLAEKKAADWLYRQVVNADIPRDPGLLSYVGADRLALRVYPVVGTAPRRTGFELLHREPLALHLDGRTVQLGDSVAALGPAAPAGAVVAPGGAVAYLSRAAKRQLPLVRRRPYYHFLLDVSAGQHTRKADYQRWIATWLAAHPLPDAPRFTLVNTYATPVPAGTDWQRQLDEFANAGGCNLTGAVRRILADAWQHPAATYPVLVAVTDSLPRTVLAADFADFAPAYPEGADFLVLGPAGAQRHSLRQQSAQPLGEGAPPLGAAVRAWPTAAQPRAYLPADAQPSVVLTQPTATLLPALPPAAPWLAGLQLQGLSQWQALHPAEANAQHRQLVQASFRAGLLAPWTAFLALENEAQKAALLHKQAETLVANANLDTVEADPVAPTGVPLDDYAGYLLALGVAVGWWHLRARRSAVG